MPVTRVPVTRGPELHPSSSQCCLEYNYEARVLYYAINIPALTAWPWPTHSDGLALLDPGAAEVPHVLPHAGAGHEEQRARPIITEISVSVIWNVESEDLWADTKLTLTNQIGLVLLQDEAVAGVRGAQGGGGGVTPAVRALCSAALTAVQGPACAEIREERW